jgi:hypothetical protein
MVVEVLVVGVVVGDCSVVLVEEAAAEFVAGAAAVVADVPAADVRLLGCAARPANSPTPASDPAATQPVVRLVRRSQVSRSEGVVMPPSNAVLPQSPLRAASVPRYNWLGGG